MSQQRTLTVGRSRVRASAPQPPFQPPVSRLQGPCAAVPRDPLGQESPPHRHRIRGAAEARLSVHESSRTLASFRPRVAILPALFGPLSSVPSLQSPRRHRGELRVQLCGVTTATTKVCVHIPSSIWSNFFRIWSLSPSKLRSSCRAVAEIVRTKPISGSPSWSSTRHGHVRHSCFMSSHRSETKDAIILTSAPSASGTATCTTSEEPLSTLTATTLPSVGQPTNHHRYASVGSTRGSANRRSTVR